MSNPKISVIIPVYNAEKYLAECFDSVLSQSYSDIEVIIVNDKSTDGSDDVIRAYQKKDQRIIYINKEKNEGVDAARIDGLQRVGGEYIIFLDCDDWCEAGLFEQLRKVFKTHPDINIIEFKYNLAFDSCHKKPADWLNRGKSGIRHVQDTDILLGTALWNKCYKTSFLRDNNLLKYEQNTSCGEIPTVVVGFLIAKQFFYLDFVGYNWRIVPNSLSRVPEKRRNHVLSFFPMLDMMKKMMLDHHLYSDSLYETIAVRCLLWNLKKDVGMDYNKVYYQRVKALFKTFHVKKSDFEDRHTYNLFKKVCWMPYFIFKLKYKGKK